MTSRPGCCAMTNRSARTSAGMQSRIVASRVAPTSIALERAITTVVAKPNPNIQPTNQSHSYRLQRFRETLRQQLSHRLVQSDGESKVAVQKLGPIEQIETRQIAIGV